ncbi:MAG: hypothetical protein JWR65_2644 [Massilia sp.]|jgi:hypothetical protein|nr:hypothetical protein [Massilia sp.]
MNKHLNKIVLGSALCVSSLAFAAEPAPLVLSELQMDSVTAGTGTSTPHRSTSNSTNQRNTQIQGRTTNISVSPTVGANVAILNTGGQNVGSYTTQSGGTQYASNR